MKTHARRPDGRMTLRGLARELSVRPQTILNWATNGVEGLLLPRRMVGAHWTYTREDYDRWQQQVQGRRERRTGLPAAKAYRETKEDKDALARARAALP